jgi:hypothetical protein
MVQQAWRFEVIERQTGIDQVLTHLVESFQSAPCSRFG